MAGRGRVKAEEIDVVIGDYIAHFSLLCTDTATNYKNLQQQKTSNTKQLILIKITE